MSKDKPRNGGEWTEARYHGFIKSALRSASQRWGPRNQCIKNARVARGLYKCECCGKVGPPTLPPPPGKKRRVKNILADHIDPIVPVTGFDSWDAVIERLFCELDGFQALCHECHSVKSKQENEARKANNAKS